MNIVWTDRALGDLVALHNYIATNNPRAADDMVRKIVGLVERQLPSMPESGRPGRLPGTRELVVPKTPYFVPYRIAGATIEVVRVIHGARRWPE